MSASSLLQLRSLLSVCQSVKVPPPMQWSMDTVCGQPRDPQSGGSWTCEWEEGKQMLLIMISAHGEAHLMTSREIVEYSPHSRAAASGAKILKDSYLELALQCITFNFFALSCLRQHRVYLHLLYQEQQSSSLWTYTGGVCVHNGHIRVER